MDKKIDGYIKELCPLLDQLHKLGCADSNCYISGVRLGMHTNGRCHCLEGISDLAEKRKIRIVLSIYHKIVRGFLDSEDLMEK